MSADPGRRNISEEGRAEPLVDPASDGQGSIQDPPTRRCCAPPVTMTREEADDILNDFRAHAEGINQRLQGADNLPDDGQGTIADRIEAAKEKVAKANQALGGMERTAENVIPCFFRYPASQQGVDIQNWVIRVAGGILAGGSIFGAVAAGTGMLSAVVGIGITAASSVIGAALLWFLVQRSHYQNEAIKIYKEYLHIRGQLNEIFDIQVTVLESFDRLANRLSSEVSALRETREDLDTEVGELKVQVDELSGERESFKKERDDAQKELESSLAKLSDTERNLASVSKRLDLVSEQVLSKMTKEMQDDFALIKNALLEQKKGFQGLSDAQSLLLSTCMGLRELQRDLGDLQENLNEKVAEIDDLTKRNEIAAREHEAANARIIEVSRELSEKLDEIDDRGELISSLNGQVESMRAASKENDNLIHYLWGVCHNVMAITDPSGSSVQLPDQPPQAVGILPLAIRLVLDHRQPQGDNELDTQTLSSCVSNSLLRGYVFHSGVRQDFEKERQTFSNE